MITQYNMTAIYVYTALFFIIGAVFGSFLNVVIYRIPEKQSIAFPPSHCMECKHPLHILDLFPIISWVLLRGKCRYCHQKISPQYPLIELLTAILFSTFFVLFKLSVETIFLCFITLLFIPLAIIDLKYQILPNKLQIMLGVIGVGVALYHIKYPNLFLYASTNPLDPLYGALIGGGILFMISLLGYFLYGRRQVMGMGDVKLLLVIGILCGFQHTLFILLSSILLAALAGIILFSFGKKKRSDNLAFGPFIIISFYLVIFIPILQEVL